MSRAAGNRLVLSEWVKGARFQKYLTISNWAFSLLVVGYCASKHAIHGLLDSLRTELIDTGVHILIACPGYVRTDIRSQASDSKDDPINQSNIMSAEECATSIRQAMEQKKREVFVVKTLSASLGPYLRWFLPEYTDRLVISKAKSGNT